MFKFIHAADIHLDSPLQGLEQYDGAPVDEIRAATRRALENLIELAIDREVDFVLIAGDLYDGTWKDYNTGLFFVSQVVKLRDAGIPTYVITGNHDAENKMTKSLPLPENPDQTKVMLSSRKAETIVLEDLGVAIHGRGFASPKVSENVVDSYPMRHEGLFNIGVLHTSMDSESDGEHARYAPCKIADLCQKQYDYWALGHIHARAIRHENPLIVYPGNLQGRHIRETGEKGCMLISVDDGGSATPEFIPLDVLRWEECGVDAGGIETADEVLDRFASQLSRLTSTHEGIPLAVRVVVEGRSAAHEHLVAEPLYWTNQLRAAALDVAGGSVWIEKVKLRTTRLRATSEAMLADGPIGELLKHCAELRDDEGQLLELAKELDDLRRKLPDESRRGDEALALDDPGWLRDMLEQVQPLLVGRLLEETQA
jgi:DNA repair exonuclease SbcCD nuclease subunit